MPRLIAFGCSFTYGQALPDCTNPKDVYLPGPKPSKLAWPQILSDMLEVECVNCGKCGASNLEILYHLLNFKFKQGDLVVVMWSVPNRDMIFQRFGKPFRQLGIWMKDRIALKWMSNLNEHDYIQKMWICMHHADLYLKSLKIQYIHFPAMKLDDRVIPYNISNLHLDGQVQCDEALDNAHPGVESHSQTAKRIYNILYDTSK